MRNMCILSLLLSLITAGIYGQENVKAVIRLKDGKSIEVYHFGKLTCESNPYAKTFTTLRGKYNGIYTEMNDYKDISKLVLSGFTSPPVASVGNQKAIITAVKKNGVSVALNEAELVMSCYGPADRYNEIHVQIINPLTEQKADLSVEIRNIESIAF
jgi:hypothetical protein